MNAQPDPSSLHAVYAPSSAHRWAMEGGCTASAEAIAHLGPQEEGEEAKEGQNAHDEIERVLGQFNGTIAEPAAIHEASRLIDPDHPAAYGIALIVDYVAKLPRGRIWVEQRVRLTDQIWGRADIQHWHEESGTLTVPDYKNGKRAVDVEENEQLRIYAAASIYTHQLPAKWVRYAVVQPNDWRPFVPRVKQDYESAESLFAFAQRVAAIPGETKKFVAGPQCRDCPLFGRCEQSLDMLSNPGALFAGLVQPEDVRPDQVAKFLAMQKPIEDSYKKFRKYWEGNTVKTGVAPDGMKIVATTPHRAWNDPDAAKALILEKIGPSALDLPTPSQAIERGMDEATIHAMAPRPDGGPALAFANDKRKPFVVKTVASMLAPQCGAPDAHRVRRGLFCGPDQRSRVPAFAFHARGDFLASRK